ICPASLLTPRHINSTLVPYTTLFRSLVRHRSAYARRCGIWHEPYSRFVLGLHCTCGCGRIVFCVLPSFTQMMLVPQASNHAMERTATRRVFTSYVATTSSLRSTRALGGRRSS